MCSRFLPAASLAVTMAAALVSFAVPAQAQLGNSTSTGTFGSRTLGGSTGLSAGGSTFARGTGTAASTPGVTQQETGAGELTGGERFRAENRQGQFVGSDLADVGAALGTFSNALGGGAAGFFSQNRGNQDGRGGNQGRNAGTGQNRNQPSLRITRRIAFSFRSAITGDFSATLARRLERSPRIQTRSPVSVSIEGRTVVLRGSVATEHDRALAAQVVLLEPGVSSVDNQLVVASPTPTEPPPR